MIFDQNRIKNFKVTNATKFIEVKNSVKSYGFIAVLSKTAQ
jgi:hypothetical protein